jgi:hypothetical protein
LVKQWFYSAGGQQHGPVGEQDLMRMLDARELPEDTLVWREGLTEWTEARKADAFAPTPYAAPASDTLTDVDWDVSLFTLITAYSRLSNHRVTTWDAAGGFQVSHRKIEWWRWLLMVSSILGLTGLMIYGSIDV